MSNYVATDLSPKKYHPWFSSPAEVVGQLVRMRAFCGVGTGGIDDDVFVGNKKGYSLVKVIRVAQKDNSQVASSAYVTLMKEIKAGFGRTLSHIPSIFGVSRQTLYNWLSGELPREIHHEKILQLAAAAKIFQEKNFKPTAQNINRILTKGHSFKELIRAGEDGKECAAKLIYLESASINKNKRIEKILEGRASKNNAAKKIVALDFGE